MSDSRNLLTRLWQGSGWSLFGTGSMALLGLGVNVVLARLLPPSEVGLYFLAATLMVFVTSLASLGTEKLATRDISARRAREDPLSPLLTRLMLTAALGGLLLGGGFFLISPWVSLYVFPEVPLGPVAGFVALWVALHAVEKGLTGVFRGCFDLRRSALLGGVLSRGGFLLGFLGVAWWGFRTIGAALTVQVAAVAASVAYGLWMVENRIGFERMAEALRNVAGSIRAGLPFAVIALLYLCTTKLDILLVGGLLNPDDVAVYTTAAKLAAVTGIPLAIINSVVQPAVSELFSRENLEGLVSVARGTATLALYLSLAALLVLLLGGRWILRVMFGGFYVQAYPILVALTLGKVIDVGTGSGGVVMTMTGREKAALWVVALSGVVMLTAGGGLGYLYGRMGVATAIVLSTLIQNLLMVLIIRRSLGVWIQASVSPRYALEVLGLRGESPF